MCVCVYVCVVWVSVCVVFVNYVFVCVCILKCMYRFLAQGGVVIYPMKVTYLICLIID